MPVKHERGGSPPSEIRMPDIFHDFPIRAEPSEVFRAVSTPDGLNRWWTLKANGTPAEGERYALFFGEPYDWRASVTRCVPGAAFELQMEESDADWQGSRVGFELAKTGAGTRVKFYHVGWPTANDHYRTSSYCWAMYLRVLRRHLEHGENVPYDERLDV